MIDDVLLETTEKMGKAVTHTQTDFSTVRTGRASPAMVEGLKVGYYGAEVPPQQLASFSVPEAQTL
ncbi:MAG: ribosome recycling factor, partial [Acidimicrobiales bacterium]